MADKKEKEVWRNVSKGVAVVNMFGPHGERLQRMIRPGQSVALSPEERRVMNIAADEKQDLFRNGILEPVSFADDTDDVEEIKSNPALISESDLQSLLSGHWKTLEKKLNEIEYLPTIERLYEMAQADEENISVKQMERIETRLRELGGIEDDYVKKQVAPDFETDSRPIYVS